MNMKVDQSSDVEPAGLKMAGASAASTSSPKVSMFAKKSGFVIPKNKLSGSLVPIFRGNKKLAGGDTASEENGKQGQRKTKWGPDLTQDAAVRRVRALAYQVLQNTCVDACYNLLKLFYWKYLHNLCRKRVFKSSFNSSALTKKKIKNSSASHSPKPHFGRDIFENFNCITEVGLELLVTFQKVKRSCLSPSTNYLTYLHRFRQKCASVLN